VTSAEAKSALLWGLVAAMAFLALYQGYVLLGADGIGFPSAFLVAVAVGAAGTAVAYVAEERLRPT